MGVWPGRNQPPTVESEKENEVLQHCDATRNLLRTLFKEVMETFVKLTLRVARLLAFCVVIGDFFVVAPAIKNNIRCRAIKRLNTSHDGTFKVLVSTFLWHPGRLWRKGCA